jgi:peptide/nickel transport system permease protein
MRIVHCAEVCAHLLRRLGPGPVLSYLVRRLLWAMVLFLAVTAVTYIIFFTIPADPARLACGQRASQKCVREAAAFIGTDQPVYVQYARFLNRLVVHHSLGRSFVNRREVNQEVLAAAPVTASLVFGGMVLWLLIAIPVGILSAVRPRSLLDRVTMVGVLVGISAHPVWIGLLAAYFFGFRLHLFPISGYCDLVNPSGPCGGPVQWAYHLFLPWATLAVLYAALYARMIRANVMETMHEEYVRTARAKGGSDWHVLRYHVLRTALLPTVTMLGMDLGLAFSGAIFIESVYGLNGLGKLALQGVNTIDLPTTMGVVVFATSAILFFTLIVDCLYAVLDPRIRLT